MGIWCFRNICESSGILWRWWRGDGRDDCGCFWRFCTLGAALTTRVIYISPALNSPRLDLLVPHLCSYTTAFMASATGVKPLAQNIYPCAGFIFFTMSSLTCLRINQLDSQLFILHSDKCVAELHVQLPWLCSQQAPSKPSPRTNISLHLTRRLPVRGRDNSRLPLSCSCPLAGS